MPEPLYALALFACPLGMGAMMWMMMRAGNKPSEPDRAANAAELGDLRAEIDQLKEAHREGSCQPHRAGELPDHASSN